MTKVAIIGAGTVGSTIAYALSHKNIAAQVRIVDVDEAKEEGQVMDIADGLCFFDTGCIIGGEYKDIRNADIIIHAAGASEKKGGTRLDLVEKNKAITHSIFKKIGKLKKTAIVIVVANPVDLITHFLHHQLKLPKKQIFGTGTSLDSARLKTKLAALFDVSAQSVQGYVFGEHGDSSFVPWSLVSIGGIEAKMLTGLSSRVKTRIEREVRNEAYEIIKKKGATHFGIGTATADITEAIILNKRMILPVSTHITSYNGITNTCLGIPAVIGASGVEHIWPIKLTPAERKQLKHSAHILQKYH